MCPFALPAGRILATVLLLAGPVHAFAAAVIEAPAAGNAAQALHARYGELRARLDHNDFGRALHLDSIENGHDLKGDAYAVVNHPFALVDAALREASSWCEILILPYNTKHCTSQAGRAVGLYVGKKKDTLVEDAYRIDFAFQAAGQARDFLQVALTADSGPLGTKGYRISLEATPLDSGRTFLHLSYAYSYGAMSNLAMQAYLATTGAAKVGFTVDGIDADGSTRYVKGTRGVLERNTMRYFLAIDAYLDSLATPLAEREGRRINDWFTASERYPRQLHEMERGDYVAMKQRELRRLAAARTAGG
jgi:hypothetical protein